MSSAAPLKLHRPLTLNAGSSPTFSPATVAIPAGRKPSTPFEPTRSPEKTCSNGASGRPCGRSFSAPPKGSMRTWFRCIFPTGSLNVSWGVL
jgi:hypothetical protein